MDPEPRPKSKNRTPSKPTPSNPPASKPQPTKPTPSKVLPTPSPDPVNVTLPGFPAHLNQITALLTDREEFHKKQVSHLTSQLSTLQSQLLDSTKSSASWEKKGREALKALEVAVAKVERLESELKATKAELEKEKKEREEDKRGVWERVRRAVEGGGV